MSEHEVSDLIAERLPYDGPHSAETVAAASEALTVLVRYLNNATRHREALPYAATVDEVVAGVDTAVYGLEQLFDQLSAALDRQAEDPSLYDDRRPDKEGSSTAFHAVTALETARVSAGQLAEALRAVRAHTAHLGNDDTDTTITSVDQ